MNLWDVLIVAAIAGIASFALWRRKKRGGCCSGGCGCGCEGCSRRTSGCGTRRG